MSDSLRKDQSDSKASRKGSLLIGIGLAAAVLVLVAAVFFLLKTTKVAEPAALVVGDRTVSRAQYDDYIALGKETSTPAVDVKSEVIEYEKNRVMADKHKLHIPEAFVTLSREDMLASATNSESDLTKLRTADDDFTKLRLYNAAFRNYLQHIAQGGWGIVLYDIPVIPSLDEAASVQRATEAAKNIRQQLVDKKLTVAEAVTAARAENIGQPAQTGAYMIRQDDGAVLGQFGGGVYGRMLDPAVLLPYLKDAQPGLTEVQQFQNLSAYFVDVLYVIDDKKPELPATVEREKTELRVVDYVK